MSDARWSEIEASVASAVKHLASAAELFERLPTISDPLDMYGLEMGFMHAMQSGHTSMEVALLRILDLCAEEPPTGPRWHADLIARVAKPYGTRPAVLGAVAASHANETRQFRSIAAHAYDSLDRNRAHAAVASASALAALLPAEIARFRQAIDP
jgi:hypothetical protein